jgi:hypothetical protein
VLGVVNDDRLFASSRHEDLHGIIVIAVGALVALGPPHSLLKRRVPRHPGRQLPLLGSPAPGIADDASLALAVNDEQHAAVHLDAVLEASRITAEPIRVAGALDIVIDWPHRWASYSFTLRAIPVSSTIFINCNNGLHFRTVSSPQIRHQRCFGSGAGSSSTTSLITVALSAAHCSTVIGRSLMMYLPITCSTF